MLRLQINVIRNPFCNSVPIRQADEDAGVLYYNLRDEVQAGNEKLYIQFADFGTNMKIVNANLDALLKNKILNGWNLFWLTSVPVSSWIVLTMMRADLSSAAAVSSMIQLSVRCAVPLLYIAFAASSLQVVFPGLCTRWLLRNRKFIGLGFAAAMAWQLFFILWLVGIHTEYYVNDVYVLSDVIEGVVGYSLLFGMVLTSFRFGRSRLTARQWKVLHKSGIYWLWFYAWSVYWFELFYYPDPPVLIDYLYYWGGFLVWGLRLLAWGKTEQTGAGGSGKMLFLVPGIVAVVIGLVGSSFGSSWSPQVYEFLFNFKIVESLDAFSPYFPLVPFYPLFLMLLGAFLIVRSKD